jgi:hypothetical protein
MTIGAHGFPILARLRPVQDVPVVDAFISVNVKPALTTLLDRPGVPCHAERLQLAVRQFDEILLERINTECVPDRKFS